MNNTLPCIDCIIYPICLSRYREYDNIYSSEATIRAIRFLLVSEKCSLLKDYAISNNCLIEFHNYFRRISIT